MSAYYNRLIGEALAATGNLGIDPRWVEGWMRLEHGTLDGLSPRQFRDEVKTGAECVRASSTEVNEDLARSYGLAGGAK